MVSARIGPYHIGIETIGPAVSHSRFDANDSCIDDLWMFEEESLELGRCNLCAAHFDQLLRKRKGSVCSQKTNGLNEWGRGKMVQYLDPINHIPPIPLITICNVARLQPPVACHRLFRGLGVLPITFHAVRRADPELAPLAHSGLFGPILPHKLGLRSRDKFADRYR